MGIRDWVNGHTGGSLMIAAAALVLAATWLYGSRVKPKPSDQYFYNLGAGNLFAADGSQIPPIDAESGPGNGVKAYVFSCGACEDASTHFIGWIETYTPQAKSLLLKRSQSAATEEDPMGKAAATIEAGHLLASVPERDAQPRWLPARSDAAGALVQNVKDRCKPAAASLTACQSTP